MTDQALNGLRVVEYGGGTAAGFATRILADLGAEVIKVESPAGDPIRKYGPFRADRPDRESSGYFTYLNAGKRGVTLDLLQEEGRAGFLELLREADLLVESGFTVADLEAGKLAYPELAQANPGLVMVSISPFGKTGPYRNFRGYGLSASALGSLSIVLGTPGKEPLSIPYEQCEFQAALHGASAALTALLARRKTGHGQFVDVAAAEVMLYYCRGMFLVTREANVGWSRRGTRQQVSIYPTGFFPCKDGYFCIASQSPKQWKKLIKIMGEPEWSKDEAMRNAMTLGIQTPDAGDAVFKPWLMSLTRKELMELAMEHDLTMGAVNRIDEIINDPHFEARKLWAVVEHSILGQVKMPGMSYLLSETPGRIEKTSPRLGEHNREILFEKNIWKSAPIDAFSNSSPPLMGGDRGEGEKNNISSSSPQPSPLKGEGTPIYSLKRPLEGYRIIDFGWNWAGPMSAQILADMGAEVIKIETSARQDLMRLMGYLRHFFRQNNRNKLSITIDIKQPGGVELVKRLASVSDVILDNFSAGVMERNGLGYQALKEVNEKIIAISMSMAGQSGPLSGMKGFASIATGYAGLEGLIGYRGEGATGLMSIGYGDTNMAIQGVFATLAALYYREKTGRGQFIDVSQIEGVMALMGKPILDFLLNGRVAEAMGNFHPDLVPHGIYPTKGEDQWVSIAVGTEPEWEAFCRVIGHPEWIKDERFKKTRYRLQNSRDLDGLISEWTRGYTNYEVMNLLQGAGVAAMPVLGVEDGDADPHLVFRKIKETWAKTDEGEEVSHYTTPWKLSETPGGIDRFTPKIGEHNEYVFKKLLKMSDNEFKELVEKKVIT
ncbi:MAG: CoA transferase [Proteobacteria bacterium]|nr:CoA transferase [Pseudomonadota bacterium]